MIIAFDITQLIYGTGVSVYISNLIEGLSRLNLGSNYQFKFFAFSRGGYAKLISFSQQYKEVPQFSFKFYPFPEKIRSLSLSLKIDPSILIGPYDLLHVPDWVGYQTKQPVLTTVHDLAIHRFPSLFHAEIVKKETKYLEWAANSSQRIICVSRTTRKDLHHYYPKAQEKTAVIYEADPFEFTQPSPYDQVTSKYKLLPRQKYFLSIATLEPRKNLKRLVQAFLAAKIPYHNLLIAGRIGWGDVKITSHPSIKLLGYVPASDLLTLLQHSSGLVYPSLWEGFGLPLAAAIAFNTPILTSSQGSMAEIAPSKAILVNPLETNSIIEGLKKLSLVKSVSYNNPFSWLKTAQETLDLYKTALRAREE